MKRVAIFGNTGRGKSTLARRQAELTKLPLHTLDMMQWRARDGDVPQEVPDDEYMRAHADLLRQEEWIIDGFGGVEAAWARFARADTLIHVDLPLAAHGWWVTKRLIKGLFAAPEGWPEGSPLWRSTMAGYGVLWPCHRKLTPRYRRLVADSAAAKRVHRLRSAAEIRDFLESVRRECETASAGSSPH